MREGQRAGRGMWEGQRAGRGMWGWTPHACASVFVDWCVCAGFSCHLVGSCLVRPELGLEIQLNKYLLDAILARLVLLRIVILQDAELRL